MKICTKCRCEKPLEDFHRHPGTRDGRTTRCRPCVAAWHAANYERNRDRIRARNAAYDQSHPGLRSDMQRRSRASDPDKVRAQGRESQARKRARQSGKVSAAEYADRLAAFGPGCWYCPGPFEHWDHIVPLSRGGLHAYWNLVPACAACNLSKHAKMPHEWSGRC